MPALFNPCKPGCACRRVVAVAAPCLVPTCLLRCTWSVSWIGDPRYGLFEMTGKVTVRALVVWAVSRRAVVHGDECKALWQRAELAHRDKWFAERNTLLGQAVANLQPDAQRGLAGAVECGQEGASRAFCLHSGCRPVSGARVGVAASMWARVKRHAAVVVVPSQKGVKNPTGFSHAQLCVKPWRRRCCLKSDFRL